MTCKTSDNYPFFREQVFCDLFMENLRVCKKLKGFLLYAWVLVWDHFHLLIRPNDEFDLSDVMFSIKKQFSHNINRIIGYNPIPEGAQALARLRLERIRFDEHVCELKNQFLQNHPNQNPFPMFKWQKSYYDHYIRNDKDFAYHWEYIKRNPEKHKMPRGWLYVFTNPKYENLNDYIY